MIPPSLRLPAMLLVPVCLLLALQLRALDYDFVWTDQAEIEHGILLRPEGEIFGAFLEPMHPDLATLSPGAAQPYYRPLQVVVASSVHNHYGKSPRAFRSVSLLLGCATIALFTFWLWLLLGDAALATAAGCLVAAHPVLIEVHLWIAALSAALAYFFLILCLLFSLLALRARSAAARVALVTSSAVALALGLFSKESVAVAPALTLAMIVTADRLARGEGDGAHTTSSGRPFGPTALALLAAQIGVTGAIVFVVRPSVLGGVLTGSPPIGGHPIVHLLSVMATWPGQLAWLFAPLHSSTSDVVPIVNHLFDPAAWLGGLLAAGSIVAWVTLLRRGHSALAFGVAWVAICFLPTSGVAPLTHARAVRYLAPSVFGAALIAALLLRAGARAVIGQRAPERVPAVLLAASLALTSVLAQSSWTRVPDWRSDIALFSADTTSDPLFREGYYVLATALTEAGRHDEAADTLLRLGEVGDRFAGYSSFLRSQDAFLLLCRVQLNRNDPAAAIALFDGRLSADSPELPKAPQAFLCGALALERAGRTSEALAILRNIHSLAPEGASPLLIVTLARCSAAAGRNADARRWLSELPPGSESNPAVAGEVQRTRALLRLR